MKFQHGFVSKVKMILRKYIKGMYNPLTLLRILHICKSFKYQDTWQWKKYIEITHKNRNVAYTLKKSDVNFQCDIGMTNWCGAIYNENKMFCVPNSSKCILEFDFNNNIKKHGNISNGEYKWTGGCKYKNDLYFFPRRRNSILKFSLNDSSLNEIPLNKNYIREHHYGGVCTKDGIVYQPPRSNPSILKINLKNMQTTEIKVPQMVLMPRYNCAVMHPNGLIYMLPEKDDKLIIVNPKTDKVYKVGKNVTTKCFSAIVGVDGNIYGFGLNTAGILKLNIKTNKIEFIHREIGETQSYGTLVGANGKLYNVPSKKNAIYEYDILNDIVKKIADIESEVSVKYVHGCINSNGEIAFSPVMMNSIYMLHPNQDNIDLSEIVNMDFMNRSY